MSLMKKYTIRIVSLAALAGLGALAITQTAPRPSAAPAPTDPSKFETMLLKTKLGSANFINGQGRVEFSFQGSLLVHDVRGSVAVTGNVVKQYEANRRTVYFGRGKVVVEGRWANVYWWGKDFDAKWRGQGVVRLDGEYYRDANGKLKTGEMWYSDVPDEIISWPGQATLDYTLPRYKAEAPSAPRRRDR